MIRIIKHGTPPDCGAIFKTKCLNCRTVFEWDTGEAQLKPDPRDGDYYEIPCPVCGRACTKQKAALRWDA